MNWDDTGYLISKNRYSENSIIAEIYTEEHGKTSGIIFGGTSKKIKNYLQIGNKIYVNYNTKSVTRIGYFKIEILKALTPLYFDHNQKLSCIASAMNLINALKSCVTARKHRTGARWERAQVVITRAKQAFQRCCLPRIQTWINQPCGRRHYH